MGTNTLTERSDGQVITQDWFNDFNQAIRLDWLPRNASNVVTNQAGSIGSNSFNWLSVYAKNYFLDNTLLDLSQFTTTTNKIISGLEASGTGGFPGYLSAGGASNLVATLNAASTNFIFSIAGEDTTLTDDLEFTTVAGYSSNNTCLVNNSAYAADPEFSKTEGEHGAYIIVDTAGSNVTAAVGTYQFFTINNGSTTELFFAYVESSTALRPIYRGMGGTSRIGFTDNDVITICRTTYLFVSTNRTAFTTTIYPIVVDSLPTAGTAGRYANRKSDDTWHYDDGANWTEVDRIWVGFGASPNSTDNTYVGYFPHVHDFNKSWNTKLTPHFKYTSASTITIPVGYQVSVAGVNHIAYSEVVVDLSSANDRESGVSEAASTMFYLYVDLNYKFRFSNIRPRPSDARGGLYHPSKLWRCVGLVFNDNSSNIVPFSYKDKIYQYHFNGSGAADITPDSVNAAMKFSTTGSYVLYQVATVPPFINQVVCKVRTAAFGIYTRKRGNTYAVETSSEGAIISRMTTINFENSTVEARDTGGSYSVVPYSFQLDL